jgi:pimeloyl-ACP methyl ester carboxylesterase
MERRTFLASASVGAVVGGPLAQLADAQRGSSTSITSSGPESFTTAEIEVDGNRVFCRRYGQGPAILMVHGFPRTSLMWRFLAPKLAGNHTVLCVDLRGYGRSGIPASADDHFLSKNTLPPTAILPAFMRSVKSIEPQPRSMSNTIALTRGPPGESSARCSIYGPRVVRSTLFMQTTAVRWAFGVNGRRAHRDRR